MAVSETAWLKFAELCEVLAATRSKLAKRAAMSQYLRTLDTAAAGLAVQFLTGAVFPETDARKLQLGGQMLVRALETVTRVDGDRFHAVYRKYGDLGAAAEELLQSANITVEESQPGRHRRASRCTGHRANSGRKVGAVGRPAAIALSAGSKISHQADDRRHAHRRQTEPRRRSDCRCHRSRSHRGSPCRNASRRPGAGRGPGPPRRFIDSAFSNVPSAGIYAGHPRRQCRRSLCPLRRRSERRVGQGRRAGDSIVDGPKRNCGGKRICRAATIFATNKIFSASRRQIRWHARPAPLRRPATTRPRAHLLPHSRRCHRQLPRVG